MSAPLPLSAADEKVLSKYSDYVASGDAKAAINLLDQELKAFDLNSAVRHRSFTYPEALTETTLLIDAALRRKVEVVKELLLCHRIDSHSMVASICAQTALRQQAGYPKPDDLSILKENLTIENHLYVHMLITRKEDLSGYLEQLYQFYLNHLSIILFVVPILDFIEELSSRLSRSSTSQLGQQDQQYFDNLKLILRKNRPRLELLSKIPYYPGREILRTFHRFSEEKKFDLNSVCGPSTDQSTLLIDACRNGDGDSVWQILLRPEIDITVKCTSGSETLNAKEWVDRDIKRMRNKQAGPLLIQRFQRIGSYLEIRELFDQKQEQAVYKYLLGKITSSRRPKGVWSPIIAFAQHATKVFLPLQRQREVLASLDNLLLLDSALSDDDAKKFQIGLTSDPKLSEVELVTIFNFACYLGSVNCVMYLLRSDPRINLNQVSTIGAAAKDARGWVKHRLDLIKEQKDPSGPSVVEKTKYQKIIFFLDLAKILRESSLTPQGLLRYFDDNEEYLGELNREEREQHYDDIGKLVDLYRCGSSCSLIVSNWAKNRFATLRRAIKHDDVGSMLQFINRGEVAGEIKINERIVLDESGNPTTVLRAAYLFKASKCARQLLLNTKVEVDPELQSEMKQEMAVVLGVAEIIKSRKSLTRLIEIFHEGLWRRALLPEQTFIYLYDFTCQLIQCHQYQVEEEKTTTEKALQTIKDCYGEFRKDHLLFSSIVKDDDKNLSAILTAAGTSHCESILNVRLNYSCQGDFTILGRACFCGSVKCVKHLLYQYAKSIDIEHQGGNFEDKNYSARELAELFGKNHSSSQQIIRFLDLFKIIKNDKDAVKLGTFFQQCRKLCQMSETYAEIIGFAEQLASKLDASQEITAIIFAEQLSLAIEKNDPQALSELITSHHSLVVVDKEGLFKAVCDNCSAECAAELLWLFPDINIKKVTIRKAATGILAEKTELILSLATVLQKSSSQTEFKEQKTFNLEAELDRWLLMNSNVIRKQDETVQLWLVEQILRLAQSQRCQLSTLLLRKYFAGDFLSKLSSKTKEEHSINLRQTKAAVQAFDSQLAELEKSRLEEAKRSIAEHGAVEAKLTSSSHPRPEIQADADPEAKAFAEKTWRVHWLSLGENKPLPDLKARAVSQLPLLVRQGKDYFCGLIRSNGAREYVPLIAEQMKLKLKLKDPSSHSDPGDGYVGEVFIDKKPDQEFVVDVSRYFYAEASLTAAIERVGGHHPELQLRPLLIQAIRDAKLANVVALLQSVGINELLDEKTKNTALIEAVGFGKLEVVRYLLAQNASWTQQNQAGKSALSLAGELVGKGGDFSSIHNLISLLEALQQDDAQEVKAILEKNPTLLASFLPCEGLVHYAISIWVRTRPVLSLALSPSSSKVIQYLKSNQDCAILIQAEARNAILQGKIPSLLNLLKSGCIDFNTKLDSHGRTIISYLILHDQLDQFKSQLQSFNPNCFKEALIAAIQRNDLREVVTLIKKIPIHIDSPLNGRGDTTLLIALENNRLAMADYLLTQGADPDLPNLQGITAAAAAKQRGQLGTMMRFSSWMVMDSQERCVCLDESSALDSFLEHLINGSSGQISSDLSAHPQWLHRAVSIDNDDPLICATSFPINPVFLASKREFRRLPGLVSELFSYGANPLRKNRYGQSALMIISEIKRELSLQLVAADQKDQKLKQEIERRLPFIEQVSRLVKDYTDLFNRTFAALKALRDRASLEVGKLAAFLKDLAASQYPKKHQEVTLRKELLGYLLDWLNKVVSTADRINSWEMLDFFFSVGSLIIIFKQQADETSGTDIHLRDRVAKFFQVRGDKIQGTPHDYPYSQCATNKICIRIAKQLWPATNPYEILSKFRQPTVTILQEVIQNAMTALADPRELNSGAEAEIFQSPLSPKTIELLTRASPALRKLKAHTDALDKYRAEVDQKATIEGYALDDFMTPLLDLAGDIQRGGSHAFDPALDDLRKRNHGEIKTSEFKNLLEDMLSSADLLKILRELSGDRVGGALKPDEAGMALAIRVSKEDGTIDKTLLQQLLPKIRANLEYKAGLKTAPAVHKFNRWWLQHDETYRKLIKAVGEGRVGQALDYLMDHEMKYGMRGDGREATQLGSCVELTGGSLGELLSFPDNQDQLKALGMAFSNKRHDPTGERRPQLLPRERHRLLRQLQHEQRELNELSPSEAEWDEVPYAARAKSEDAKATSVQPPEIASRLSSFLGLRWFGSFFSSATAALSVSDGSEQELEAPIASLQQWVVRMNL